MDFVQKNNTVNDRFFTEKKLRGLCDLTIMYYKVCMFLSHNQVYFIEAFFF